MSKRLDYPGQFLPQKPPFQFYTVRSHGLWACRGFNSNGLHFNRSFRSKAKAHAFLKAMMASDEVSRY
jgi:hypothetical protein